MSLEKELAKEIRATKLRRAILSTVEVAGVITLAVMAPKLLPLVGRLQERRNEKLKSAVLRLKEKGLIQIDSRGIQLTAAGRKYLAKNSVPRPLKWDRKWRIVIFDIREERKAYRDLLRRQLRSIGFERLQDSVWLYPFDCEELLTLLKTDFRLGSEVQYIIADKIERSAKWEKAFDL